MKRVSILALLLAARAWAQLAPQSLTLTAGPPSPIIIVSPQATPPFGGGSYCWWVIANYPIGHSTPSPPGCTPNIQASAIINWNTVPGAISYDVLRTSTPILPNVPSNIAVGTLLSGPSLVDNFGGLSSYTVNTAGAATALFLLDNQNQANPAVRLTLTNTAGYLNSFIIGSGGAGTPGGTSGQIQYNNAGGFGGFTLGGDATANTSTGILTFSTVNSGPGSCGDATHVCQVTTNGKGLVTIQTPVAITAGTGNAAAIVTVSFSATPTFTAPSNTAGTVVDFQAASNAPIVMTGNITSSTFSNGTPGSIVDILLKQDATGHRTFAAPSSFSPPVIHPAPNTTTALMYYWDGANGRLLSSFSDAGYGACSEAATPTDTPPAGIEYASCDSSRGTALQINSAGQKHIMPRTAQTGDQLGGADLLAGALANGMAATTQAADDNSTKIATTAYVDRLKARAISFSIGDPQNSSALTTSNVAYLASVPFACTISAWNLAIDAGTITVKFWKVATGTAIPTSGNSINTSGVAISSGTAIHSTTVSDFTTTAVAANDIMAMAVTAVATAKFISGVLECDQ